MRIAGASEDVVAGRLCAQDLDRWCVRRLTQLTGKNPFVDLKVTAELLDTGVNLWQIGRRIAARALNATLANGPRVNGAQQQTSDIIYSSMGGNAETTSVNSGPKPNDRVLKGRLRIVYEQYREAVRIDSQVEGKPEAAFALLLEADGFELTKPDRCAWIQALKRARGLLGELQPRHRGGVDARKSIVRLKAL